VRPGRVIAGAAHAGRRYWKQILAVAIPVTVFSAGLELIIDHVDPNQAALSITASITATFISVLGTVLLSGLVCRLVGVAEHGREPLGLWQVMRSLRWWSLIGADLLATAIVVAGVLLFVVPGLIALTLLALVGPVIDIEDRGVLGAIRRSVHLVRQHVWPVVLLGTIPMAAASELEALAPEPHGASEIVRFFVVRGLAEGIAEACIALALAELCFQLIDAEPHTATAASPVSPASPAHGEVATGITDNVAESRRGDRIVPDDGA
jgi:hypothetical protein